MATTNEVQGVPEEALFHCPGAAEMAAFDDLPRVMRDALNYAPGNVSARQCAQEMEHGLPPMLVLSMAQDSLIEHYGRSHDGWGTQRHRPCRR